MKLPHMDKRILVIDANRTPAQMMTNCLTCNRLTEELESEGIMCRECDRKWSVKFAKEYVLPY